MSWKDNLREAMRTWTPRQKFRHFAVLFAVISIASGGSLLGAAIKTDRQREQRQREFLETTPRQQIATLEGMKRELRKGSDQVQRTIDLRRELMEEQRVEEQRLAERKEREGGAR